MSASENRDGPGPGLMLRDAVAILPEGRRDLKLRLKRAAGLAQRLDLDLEITLDARFFVENNHAMIEAIAETTRAFGRTAYHLHSSEEYLFGNNPHTRQLVEFCWQMAAETGLEGLCVHPDLVEDITALAPLAGPDFYVAAEVLDELCDDFNTLESISRLLEEHSFLTLVLDTAHIAGMLPEGGVPVSGYVKKWGSRVVEVHISQIGNHYDPGKMGPNFRTNHSLLTLGRNVLEESLQPLTELKNLNLAIEGVIPAGDYGEELLQHEVTALRNFLSA